MFWFVAFFGLLAVTAIIIAILLMACFGMWVMLMWQIGFKWRFWK